MAVKCTRREEESKDKLNYQSGLLAQREMLSMDMSAINVHPILIDRPLDTLQYIHPFSVFST